MSLVAQGLSRNSTQPAYIVSQGFGGFLTLGLGLNDLLCVIQNVRIIEAVQMIDACETGRVYV